MKIGEGKPDFALDGKEAVEKVLNKHCQHCGEGYVLVFMDINMPVMDGFQATGEILKMMRN